jgi:hypothetical protein
MNDKAMLSMQACHGHWLISYWSTAQLFKWQVNSIMLRDGKAGSRTPCIIGRRPIQEDSKVSTFVRTAQDLYLSF